MEVNTVTLAELATALLAVGAACRIGLAVGAPCGATAYGGRAVCADGTLPRPYPVGSAIAAVVRLAAIRIVLAAASVLPRGPASSSVLTVALRCPAAFFALNTLGNAFGRHPVERRGAGTVTAVLAVLCARIPMG